MVGAVVTSSRKPLFARVWEVELWGGQARPPSNRLTLRNVEGVDNRSEIRDFLATRRAKLTPAQVGLPTAGRRRVPGLRREEVAVLAGVSTDWYNRLEKGHKIGRAHV